MASTCDEIRVPNAARGTPRRRGWRGALWQHRWLIVIVTALFCAASLAWSFVITPVYQANAVVQAAPDVAAGPEDPAQGPRAAADTRAARALLASTLVLGPVVAQLDLAIVARPQRLPVVGDLLARLYRPPHGDAVARSWLGLDAYAWGGSRIELARLEVPDALLGSPLTLVARSDHRFDLHGPDGTLLLRGRSGSVARGHGVTVLASSLRARPGTHFSVMRRTHRAAVAHVRARLATSRQRSGADLVGVHLRDTDPRRAVAILDAIVRQYALTSAQRAAADAAQALKFVSDQLPATRRQLAAAKAALADYRATSPVPPVSGKTMQVLDKLAAVQTQQRQRALRQAENEQMFTWQAADDAVAPGQQKAALDVRQAQLQKRLADVTAAPRALLQRMLAVRVDARMLASLNARARQLQALRAGPGPTRFIGAAVVDRARPVEPRRALIVTVGTLLGLFLAVAGVSIASALRNGVEDPRVIERLGLPVYASIPLSGHQRDIDRQRSRDRRRGARRLHVLALDEPCDLAVEAIRSLRTSVHLATLEADSNVLMLSGVGAGVGTTFVCANLALVVAKAGRRVLLLDADLRKGTLHHVMGDGAGGLSDVLRGRVRLDAAVQHTPVEGLDFLARGRMAPDPCDLLARPGWVVALDALSTRYDLVVIDTPPILTHADAALIGRHAGTRLLVARFGTNRAPELELARQRFAHEGIAIRGAIFNAIRMHATGYYYRAREGYRSAA